MMKTKQTADLGLALYLMGVNPSDTEISEYISLVEGNNGFIWYQIDNLEVEAMLSNIFEFKNERKFLVCDFYKLEHIIGILKKMCINKKQIKGDR